MIAVSWCMHSCMHATMDTNAQIYIVAKGWEEFCLTTEKYTKIHKPQRVLHTVCPHLGTDSKTEVLYTRGRRSIRFLQVVCFSSILQSDFTTSMLSSNKISFSHLPCWLQSNSNLDFSSRFSSCCLMGEWLFFFLGKWLKHWINVQNFCRFILCLCFALLSWV